MKEKIKDEYWLATRDGIPCGSFETRKKAIKWLKAILRQLQTDIDKQDTTDEYDYEIELKKIEIRRYNKREPYLGF